MKYILKGLYGELHSVGGCVVEYILRSCTVQCTLRRLQSGVNSEGLDSALYFEGAV